MKVVSREGSVERQILIGMITDGVFLGHVAAKWRDGMFASRLASVVAELCVDYYRQYRQAPAATIEPLFADWARRSRDKEAIRLVEGFLASLSGEFDGQTVPLATGYLLDRSRDYFNGVQLAQLGERLERCLEDGDVETALSQVSSFRHVEMGQGAGIDVLQDEAALRAVFAVADDSIVLLPEALARFYGDTLGRECFVAYMAPEKRGKTWFLIDLAWMAMLGRRKVAFFEVGDMSERQILRRFLVRAARHPAVSSDGNWPCTVRWPSSLEREEEEIQVSHRELTFESPLSWEVAWRACQKVVRARLRSDDSFLRLSVHPNSTISVDGIRSVLQDWERQEWVPDVVVVDYADILAPLDRRGDPRNHTNDTWAALRGLSQSHHCLVATATQSDAESYSVKTITRRNFSWDKRKLAHVTAMFGINQTAEEREQGLYRLNRVAVREGECDEFRCIHLASCLPLARPWVRCLY